MRIESGAFATSYADDEIQWSFDYDSIHPLTNRLKPKSSFLPSKHEAKRVAELVRKIEAGHFDQKEKEEEDVFELWPEDTDPSQWKPRHKRLEAPPIRLPGHAESYNPPTEYLFTEEEKKEWEETEPEDRVIPFIPQKFDTLRHVPAYEGILRDQYQRYLDLHAFPRLEKRRVQIDPDSLLPSLPQPSDLLPFPQKLSIEFKGHTQPVTAVTCDPHNGEYMASGAYDGTLRVWDVLSGRSVRSIKFNAPIEDIAWNPMYSIIAVASGNMVYLYSPNLNPISNEKTNLMLRTDRRDKRDEDGEDGDNKDPKSKSILKWRTPDSESKQNGVLLERQHPKPVLNLAWHPQGIFLSCVSSDNSASSLYIHNIATRKTAQPSNKRKLVRCGMFHPAKQQYFVAYLKHIEIHSLDKTDSVRKLRGTMTNITSMCIHPTGDHLIASSAEGKISWYDLNSDSNLPFRVLAASSTQFYRVSFHPAYPLFAGSTLKGTIQVVHGSVTTDPTVPPLIVPVKLLFGPKRITIRRGDDGEIESKEAGVPSSRCCAFHSRQPWIFGGFDDGVVRMYI
ncbi:putative Ribosome biogenesis protein bop1 [Blattamonas nauphoetae]|uniref:Ribosome biogenesis protein bop1 n=1 Tax=Blattamonas nauphoetae TaxID=2049346 RepID=A0ABQ9Y4T1_9EUKA|nr:putative Ribosome biogenesis protein bop1 [Blattamonas nauphoetae]